MEMNIDQRGKEPDRFSCTTPQQLYVIAKHGDQQYMAQQLSFQQYNFQMVGNIFNVGKRHLLQCQKHWAH